MSKYSRKGGKYAGSHTTLIPAATAFCDAVHKIPEVRKISLGFIRAGLKSISGNVRVKIHCHNGYILLSVRGNNSHQEIHVYTTDMRKAVEAISEKATLLNIKVALNTT